LFANPRHPYTQGLLRSVPRLDTPPRAALAPIVGLPPDLSRLPAGCAFRPRCPRAFARCSEASPEISTPAPDHQVRCFASEQDPA
jgi:oligopeptide/dipeptide ABC transporter ATP-binding protein